MQNVTPRGRFVLVKVLSDDEISNEEVTVGGIVLGGDVDKDKRPSQTVAKAEIIAIGRQGDVTTYSPGMKVMYNYFAGNQFIIPSTKWNEEDQAYHLVFEDDILATYED